LDDAVDVLAGNGILRGIDDGGEMKDIALERAALGQIARNTRDAVNLPRRREHRRYRDRDGNTPAVLPDTFGLEMFDRITAADSFHRTLFLIDPLRR
jgi:hypothetical protein